MPKSVSKPLLVLAAGTMVGAGIGGYAYFQSLRPSVLEVYVFNTAGLPSIFIRTPQDKRILINGGANADIIRSITSILPFYSRRIDTLIATDQDPRNTTGLIEVLNRYTVDLVILPAVTAQSVGLATSTDPVYQTFLDTINQHAIAVRKVSVGDIVPFDSYATSSVVATVLFPESQSASPKPQSSNQKSFTSFIYSNASPPMIVLRIDYGAVSIIIAGNASPKIQKWISANYPYPANILIVSTSLDSSNVASQLIGVVKPDYLIYKGTTESKPSLNAPTKQKADPLAGILMGNRFNVATEGVVKIVSDGKTFEIK